MRLPAALLLALLLALLSGCDGELRLGPGGAGGASNGGSGQGGEAAGSQGCEPACEGIRVCAAGRCECPALTVACGKLCVDTWRDPLHCGGCGEACKESRRCVAGECECLPGASVCDLGEERCVDLGRNPERCGSCAGPGCEKEQVCVEGGCREDCPAGLVRCQDDGRSWCSELATDRKNCGECGRSCDTGEVCLGGVCRRSAPATPCASCPCPGCSALLGLASCCPTPGGPLCVEGDACP